MKYVGLITLFVVAIISRGFVLSILWDWFIFPIGINYHLSITHAIGFSLVIGFLTFSYSSDNEKTESFEYWTKKIITSIIFPFTVLFFGWIISLFMD